MLQDIAQYICPLLFHSACTWSRLRGWITKQLPAKPSSDNHRVEGKYELLLLLSSLMLDPPLKYQFVPIAPYTGCAQWPSTGKVPAHSGALPVSTQVLSAGVDLYPIIKYTDLEKYC